MVDRKDIDLRLAVTDSPVGNAPEKIRCTQHTDPSSSLCVYRDNLHCYGCGFHLVTMPGLAYLLYGAWDKAAMRRAGMVAEKYTARSLDAYRERVTVNARQDPLPRTLASLYKIMLYNQRRHRLEWFYDRGLTDESIDRFNLGHDGTRFTLPIYSDNGDLLTLRYRRDDHYGTSYFDARRGVEVSLPKYSGVSGRNGLYLFAADEIDIAITEDHIDYLVVVEGELDAVRLWQEGVPAVSTTNGAGNVHRVPGMLREAFPQIKRLFFATDQDEPGRAAAKQGYLAATQAGFKASWIEWPVEWGKDITELLRAGHRLEELDVYGDELELPRA